MVINKMQLTHDAKSELSRVISVLTAGEQTMAMHITDMEYAMGLRASQAANALDAANQQVRIANAEIARLRRQLVAANTRIGELETESRTLAERLIAMLRRH